LKQFYTVLPFPVFPATNWYRMLLGMSASRARRSVRAVGFIHSPSTVFKYCSLAETCMYKYVYSYCTTTFLINYMYLSLPRCPAFGAASSCTGLIGPRTFQSSFLGDKFFNFRRGSGIIVEGQEGIPNRSVEKCIDYNMYITFSLI